MLQPSRLGLVLGALCRLPTTASASDVAYRRAWRHVTRGTALWAVAKTREVTGWQGSHGRWATFTIDEAKGIV